MNEIKVGSKVEHYAERSERVILVTTIVRETATQWVDANGSRWRKSDRAQVPQYSPEPRFIRPVPQ